MLVYVWLWGWRGVFFVCGVLVGVYWCVVLVVMVMGCFGCGCVCLVLYVFVVVFRVVEEEVFLVVLVLERFVFYVEDFFEGIWICSF